MVASILCVICLFSLVLLAACFCFTFRKAHLLKIVFVMHAFVCAQYISLFLYICESVSVYICLSPFGHAIDFHLSIFFFVCFFFIFGRHFSLIKHHQTIQWYWKIKIYRDEKNKKNSAG